MFNIEITFQKTIRDVDALWIRRVITETLLLEKKRNLSLSILLTDNKNIRKINKRFLKHDYATDVISFWYDAGVSSKSERDFLGELVVSWEMAREFAKKLEISFKEELARYLIHGTLHLLGYDDKQKKDKNRMHRRQEFILRKVL